MVDLLGVCSKIKRAKVLVIGDFFLDAYTFGKVKRISPEAPVAVVQAYGQDERPGGAGNVVLNLLALGARVFPMGRVGSDQAGEKIQDSFLQKNVETKAFFVDPSYQTPIKNRVIADNQQIVRIDHEVITPLSEQVEAAMVEVLPELFSEVDIIALSDYGKGGLPRSFLSSCIQEAKKQNKTLIVDPKGSDYTKYRGASFIKPNLKEAYAASGKDSDASLEEVAKEVLSITEAEILMITRSEEGISLFFQDGKREDFPVSVREIKDVTGAGDTVLAVLALALGSSISLQEGVRLSNIVAGMAIERFGCATISLGEVARQLLILDPVNKIFDEEHLFVLQQAVKGKKYSILSISAENGFTSPIFAAIQKLSGETEGDLLVYIREKEPDPEFVQLLSSLSKVNFIIVKTESLEHFVSITQPQEVFVLEEEEVQKLEHAEALFE